MIPDAVARQNMRLNPTTATSPPPYPGCPAQRSIVPIAQTCTLCLSTTCPVEFAVRYTVLTKMSAATRPIERIVSGGRRFRATGVDPNRCAQQASETHEYSAWPSMLLRHLLAFGD